MKLETFLRFVMWLIFLALVAATLTCIYWGFKDGQFFWILIGLIFGVATFNFCTQNGKWIL